MNQRNSFHLRFWFVVDLLIGCVAVAFWSVVLFWLARWIGLLPPGALSTFHAFLGAGGVFVAGVLAFALRLWLRRAYGIAEVIFALVVAWWTMRSLPGGNGIQVIVVLGSAVYLVVRGLDNWFQGMEGRREDGL